MNPKEKTRHILDLISRRSTVPPNVRPIDARFARVGHLPRDTLFSGFNPQHAVVASEILQVLNGAKDFEDFVALADQVRPLECDGLFLYVLYSSVLHRDDCQGVFLPPIEEVAPHWFFSAQTLHKAIQLSIHEPEKDHTVVNERTAENTEPENRLAYFREDVSLNTHHWSWHVVFPFEWNPNVPGKIKDRKGEIFYYMHQQMVARYNCERLSNELNRVSPLQNFRESLEGYFPHMTDFMQGKNYGSRPSGMNLRDLPDVSVQDLEIWRIRLLEAIDEKFVRDVSGRFISLDNEKGIDILGAMVESSLSSPNRDFYGNLHNMGHMILASVQDPDRRFKDEYGSMAFEASAASDPIFYRWHALVDYIFNRHKTTLTPYTPEELAFDGIVVEGAEVRGEEKNVIKTFMKKDKSDLSHAPFLQTEKSIMIEYEHMDYEPLTFSFLVHNNTGAEKEVTIRVFMGPKYDENGNAFVLDEQRRFMIELDKIKKTLTPGLNEISRPASESSVTMPRREIKSFRMLQEGNFEEQINYCTCGWPEHMLIPRGTSSGMDFVLFVMCTDYEDDKPDSEAMEISCEGGISYCGAKDNLYPDKKPMGYPFDRRIDRKDHPTMQEFLKPNMTCTDVKVKFMG